MVRPGWSPPWWPTLPTANGLYRQSCAQPPTPIPDTQRHTNGGHLTVLWAACGSPTLAWTGGALPHPPCQDCERIVGPMPAEEEWGVQ